MIVESYRQLAYAQKGHARGAPAYSVYVNRRLGR
ncbi:MAG TPA: CDP-alcohol phosphatidyltransferase, partial [Brevibacterium sp.]|nr:CDP-alcohol phosphatidyltransferase [Brevibacterium sp.]